MCWQHTCIFYSLGTGGLLPIEQTTKHVDRNRSGVGLPSNGGDPSVESFVCKGVVVLRIPQESNVQSEMQKQVELRI